MHWRWEFPNRCERIEIKDADSRNADADARNIQPTPVDIRIDVVKITGAVNFGCLWSLACIFNLLSDPLHVFFSFSI